MKPAHEIVNEVHGAFRGICARLATITSKSAEWFSSHGREPKSLNPLAGGNPSAVTHYMQYAAQHEAAAPGAGRMLNNRVHAALEDDFNAEIDLVPQSQIHAECLSEAVDVIKIMGEQDLSQVNLPDLKKYEGECAEMEDAASRARARVKAEIRLRSVRDTAKTKTLLRFKEKA